MSKLFILLFFLVFDAYAYYFTSVKFLKNYDGDTITVNITSVHPLLGDSIGVRINGIDTPEIRGKTECEKEKAIKARDFVKDRLSVARRIMLKDCKRGKYFRIVADVIYDGKNIGNELLEKGLAIPYDGGTKRDVDWCKERP